ncbi:MAG: phospho-N-acetylmuramoyl-pentapeptide-transferase [Clostridia bacterium]|nr:phospho-N-acetylmuramoyl-pentapeptide-transferase [Clostridia bacterium]
MVNLLLAFLLTFLVAVLFAPLVIKLAKKVGAKQEILEYVTAHKNKQGTATMGGLIFVLPAIIIALVFCNGQASVAYVALGVFFGYCLLGFLDDFIKVHTHKNLGLRAYQKVIGQVGIAVIAGLFMYYSGIMGSVIYLPWGGEVDLSWGIIPFVIFVFLAMTNASNLTDGLDGLTGWTSFIMLIGIVAIIGITDVKLLANGGGGDISQQLQNLMLVGVTTAGGLLAFLCFNSFPAKIFMGDTGSLALGGVITSLAVFSGWTLLLPIICVVFVVSAVSVVIQVLHYKRTKRRVFLMAPLHHHFEKKGVNETKIVAIYIVVTIIACVLGVLCSLL